MTFHCALAGTFMIDILMMEPKSAATDDARIHRAPRPQTVADIPILSGYRPITAGPDQ
jgi:hypothetical protein